LRITVESKRRSISGSAGSNAITIAAPVMLSGERRWAPACTAGIASRAPITSTRTVSRLQSTREAVSRRKRSFSIPITDIRAEMRSRAVTW
jgi:hypothetical protein